MMELLKERQPLSATRKPPTFQRLRRRAGFWGFEWTNEPHRGGNTSPPQMVASPSDGSRGWPAQSKAPSHLRGPQGLSLLQVSSLPNPGDM